MARKGKLDATPIETPETEAAAPVAGGFWGGSMRNLMTGELKDARDRLAALAQGVRLGLVTIEIDTDRIDDAVGGDRLQGWEDEPDFLALVEDIERRGQRAPIRVRPADPDWAPDPRAPLQTAPARFVVQSGRRRLAALRRLGRPALALVSTPEGEAEIDDLEERFLENTVRKSLTPFEELLSIGVLASRLGELPQKDVAARLKISAPDVSLGLACLEMREQISASVDVAATPKRAYRDLIPRLRKAQGPAVTEISKEKQVTKSGSREKRRFRRFQASLAIGPRRATVAIRDWKGDPAALTVRIEAFLRDLDAED
jgi:ParB family chromosome partitioning protein